MNKYDLIVLDEINVAVYYKLIDKNILLNLLQKTYECWAHLTGRYASKEIIEIADLVTEMTEIKHYYSNGVLAREGIEK